MDRLGCARRRAGSASPGRRSRNPQRFPHCRISPRASPPTRRCAGSPRSLPWSRSARRSNAGSAWARNWRMDVGVATKAPLITDSLFAYIRHPIYAFSILLMLCTVAIVPTLPMLVVAVVHIALMNAKARSEERHLLAVHGDAYARYLRASGRFLPRRGRPQSVARAPIAVPYRERVCESSTRSARPRSPARSPSRRSAAARAQAPATDAQTHKRATSIRRSPSGCKRSTPSGSARRTSPKSSRGCRRRGSSCWREASRSSTWIRSPNS